MKNKVDDREDSIVNNINSKQQFDTNDLESRMDSVSSILFQIIIKLHH